ncbi:DivIVA domain-containing protein [Nocardiopsis alba]
MRNSRFRTTRMSPGYREDEVDDFPNSSARSGPM